MFNFSFRVEYIDTDAMGIVHHASYLRYFERTRVEWLRSVGLSYRKMEEDGYMLPVHSCTLSYKLPLHFDDEFTVKMIMGEMENASMTLHYEVWSDGKLRTTGSTRHVLCFKKVENFKTSFVVTKIPKEWRALWQQLNEKKS